MVRISNIELLKKLMENSRARFVELAEYFNVSETAIRKKIKKLEHDGVIRKYCLEVDPKKIGFGIQTIIGLDTKPESFISIMERLRKHDVVRTLYSATGDHMLLFECWFVDHEALTKFVKFLEGMRGVEKVCPAIILERVK